MLQQKGGSVAERVHALSLTTTRWQCFLQLTSHISGHMKTDTIKSLNDLPFFFFFLCWFQPLLVMRLAWKAAEPPSSRLCRHLT